MKDAAFIAIEKLREHRNEIDSAMESRSTQQADEKIERWYQRTKKCIDVYVSNSEAHAFNEFTQRQWIDGYDYTEIDLLRDKIQYYKDKIDVLIEELEKRPETVLDPSKLQVQESVPVAHVLSLIHPQIIMVSAKRFDSGEFSDAVLSAFKAVNNRVKAYYKKMRSEELDGTALMQKAFSEEQVINVGDLSTSTGRDMQTGYRFIFAGSMLAIRNPKAHDEVTIDKGRAIHFLYLASLEMYKLDEAGVDK